MHLIAAHADDELLGAFTLLAPSMTVVLVATPSPARLAGSRFLARELGHRLEVREWDWVHPNGWWALTEYVKGLTGRVFIPSPLDANPVHRQLSALTFFCRDWMFYSVLPLGWQPSGKSCMPLGLWERKKELIELAFPAEVPRLLELLEQVGPYEYFFTELDGCRKLLDHLPYYS